MPRPPNYTQYITKARSATFDLVPTAPFAPDWFDPKSHPREPLTDATRWALA
jgi:hypothetical protein